MRSWHWQRGEGAQIVFRWQRAECYRGSTDGVSPKTSSTHARHAREHATPNAGCTVQSREPEKRLASSTDVNARPVTVDSCPVRAPEEVTTYYNSVVIISSHLGASDCPRLPPFHLLNPVSPTYRVLRGGGLRATNSGRFDFTKTRAPIRG